MDIRQNVSLAPYTTFGIGGPADYFVEVTSSEEIIEAVQWAKNPLMHSGQEISFFLLGTGANILVGDKGYRGLVIKNNSSQFTVDGSWLRAESGTTIEELIKFTCEKGLSGFEHFAGIPSSVGGALWQNLHFLSPDRSKTVFIGDMVQSAVILSSSSLRLPVPLAGATEGSAAISEIATSQASRDDVLKPMTMNQSYFQFSYDYSILHDTHDIVLSAMFVLTPEDPQIIQERIAANLKWRAQKHPTNAVKTSAGSIFKKIEGYGAGRLIEQVGLKGKILGGAKVSDQHANFILNENAATAKDVRDLIELIQTTVKKELGLTLQTEISFIGEF